MGESLSRSEIRFTESWREQRKGSKAGYYLLYTFSWGLVSTFIIFFLLMFLGGISIIPIAQDNKKITIIVGVGFILGFCIALLVRYRNEKKYQRILRKIGKEGD